MNDKLVRDLVLDLAGTTTFQSEAVLIGSDNCAMFEVWVKSKSGSTQADVSLEGSSDRLNWSAVNGMTPLVASTLPSYNRSDIYVDTIPYAYLRLSIVLTGSSGAMLLDAALRTFMTGG